MQHEITRAIPLLDSEGNLTEPGYAKKLLPVYRRADIKAGKMRIKEWDYYLVNNGRFALALTVDDNGYMGLDSISLLDFENGWEITTSPMSFMPLGKLRMPETSAVGDVHHAGSGHSITFKNDGSGHRTLIAQMKKFGPAGSIYARVELFDEPEESMVICTPFDKPGHFYYNQKINCMRAKGEVVYDGKTYVFDPSDSFAVLDWGRGVWTYHNTWYWGSASGELDGVPFGWNIGYGFGNTAAASENALFYDGTLHKLSRVTFEIPQKDGKYDYLAPWKFTSDDNRFYMDFTPVLDRSACMNVGVLKSDQHQVFGLFTGRVTLDDGTVLPVRDFFGFAERVENKW